MWDVTFLIGHNVIFHVSHHVNPLMSLQLKVPIVLRSHGDSFTFKIHCTADWRWSDLCDLKSWGQVLIIRTKKVKLPASTIWKLHHDATCIVKVNCGEFELLQVNNIKQLNVLWKVSSDSQRKKAAILFVRLHNWDYIHYRRVSFLSVEIFTHLPYSSVYVTFNRHDLKSRRCDKSVRIC